MPLTFPWHLKITEVTITCVNVVSMYNSFLFAATVVKIKGIKQFDALFIVLNESGLVVRFALTKSTSISRHCFPEYSLRYCLKCAIGYAKHYQEEK